MVVRVTSRGGIVFQGLSAPVSYDEHGIGVLIPKISINTKHT